MKYEVSEDGGEWVVRREGAEVARFAQQDDALAYVAERLKARETVSGSYSLTMRYQARG
jgi:hypothetical protein